jgi:hypothetical protein
MQATRTFFIGGKANPCMGAPHVPKNLNGFDEHPAAIAARPIHAVPLTNSLLLDFMVVLSLLIIVCLQDSSDEFRLMQQRCLSRKNCSVSSSHFTSS